MCPYCTKLEPIFKAKDNFTRHARGDLKLNHTLGERPANPPRDYPRRTPKKMFLTISDLARVRKIFLKGQDIFSVFCPQGLGQGF